MTLDAINVDRLMADVRTLCKDIGARPPTSPAERRAADYVQGRLQALGIADIRRQEFDSPDSEGWSVLPYLLMGALSLPVARLGRLGKLLGGGLLLNSALGVRDSLKGKPPVYQTLLARGRSQNVIARIPSSGETRQLLFLTAHLDTGKQRFMIPFALPALTRPLVAAALALVALGGASMQLDGLLGCKGTNRTQQLAGVTSIAMLAGALFDEIQPHIEGANDNASAVAVLLWLAETLKTEPLEHTEVTVVFTGSSEAGFVGIEKYLAQYAPPRDSSYWIDLEMVGSGELSYVARHGVSLFTDYRPTPRLTALAARLAREQTELGVAGRNVTTMDEVAPLIRRGYEAIRIAGVDEQGQLPNWHRTTDTLERLEPEVLTRAARYVWMLARAIDSPRSPVEYGTI